MSRFLTAVLVLLALPVLTQAQEPAQAASGTHTVVRGETLWDLSRTYFGDPFNWRVLHEANSEIIANPHWIYPGQVLTIPGLPPRREQLADTRDPSEVTAVSVESPGGSAIDPRDMMAVERTIFFRDNLNRLSGPGVLSGEEARWLAVPRDIFYSAGWLIPLEAEPDHIARIEAFEQETRVRSRSRTIAHPFEPLHIRFTQAERPGMGDRLLSFRIERKGEGGQVIVPSGILQVHRIESGGAIAVPITEYNRVQLGDFLIRLPAFALEPGVHPTEVSDGMTARVLGFQRVRDLHTLGDIVFLDRGEADGVRVGDEFIALLGSREGSEAEGRIAGRLQVIGVRESGASARIVHLDGPIFEKGMSVRLAGSMP